MRAYIRENLKNENVADSVRITIFNNNQIVGRETLTLSNGTATTTGITISGTPDNSMALAYINNSEGYQIGSAIQF